jgi:hypothetical protein
MGWVELNFRPFADVSSAPLSSRSGTPKHHVVAGASASFPADHKPQDTSAHDRDTKRGREQHPDNARVGASRVGRAVDKHGPVVANLLALDLKITTARELQAGAIRRGTRHAGA